MSTEPESSQFEQSDASAVTPEQTGGEHCRSPEEIRDAAVQLAKKELERAQKFYDEVRQQAADKIQAVRDTTIGEVVDDVMEAVKQYPCASLFVSASVGFCLGRWFQRVFSGEE